MSDQAPIIARFQITEWNDAELPGVKDGWATGAAMAKTFTAGMTGASEGVFITSGAIEGQRGYIATEHITCTFEDGRSGSFVVQHGGQEDAPDSWFGYIVPGTGTGDLEGISGKAPLRHDGEGAYFEFTVE